MYFCKLDQVQSFFFFSAPIKNPRARVFFFFTFQKFIFSTIEMSDQFNVKIRGIALRVLVEEFNINPYPSKELVSEIATRVRLGHRKVVVWFQNRRQRLKIVKYPASRKRSVPKNPACSEFQIPERNPRPTPPLVHYLLPPPLEETNTSTQFYDSTSHVHSASVRGPIRRKEPPFHKHPHLYIESLLNPQDKEYPYRIRSNLEIKIS